MTDISIQPTARKYGLIYGVISLIYGYALMFSGLVTNPLMSFLSIAIGVGMVFLAIREYKKLNGGYLTLKQGIMTGLWVGLIAAVISGIFSFVYSNWINPDFTAELLNMLEQQMADSGNPPEMVEMTMKIYEFMFQPVPALIMALVSGVIGGALYGLIVGAIMKNERPMLDE